MSQDQFFTLLILIAPLLAAWVFPAFVLFVSGIILIALTFFVMPNPFSTVTLSQPFGAGFLTIGFGIAMMCAAPVIRKAMARRHVSLSGESIEGSKAREEREASERRER